MTKLESANEGSTSVSGQSDARRRAKYNSGYQDRRRSKRRYGHDVIKGFSQAAHNYWRVIL